MVLDLPRIATFPRQIREAVRSTVGYVAPMRAATRVAILVCASVASADASAACPRRSLVAYEARSFLGYACDADCEPQKAGFAWAERHGISSPLACAAVEAGFEAGCRAYAAQETTSFESGYDWALENEVADPCLCDGGGDGFRRGCLAYVARSQEPACTGCAEALPGRAEPFPAVTRGR